jgi:serine/threonine-protein kinase
MDPQRHAQVKRGFREALRWPAADRAAVAAALADDEAVRDEALSLLAHHREEPAPEQPPVAIGAVVGERYRIAARVRAGGYRAEDTVERRPVALEQMPEDAAPVEALIELSRQAGAFVRVEGECAWQGPAGAVRFALVEWLDGPTLAELRAPRTAAGWPLERAIHTLAPIAEALAIAAERGIVHRAVRADRVVLTGGDEIARLAGLPAARASSAAPVASRIDAAEAAAAAPEQLSPALGPIGPWTDVYGLALVCVELMLGRPAAGSATVAAAFARTRDEAAQPTPRGVGLEVPDAVQAVLARALAMRPMERYQDVRRFWAALRESLPASPPASAGAAPAPPPSPPRRRSWPALAAAAAALAALAALAAQRCG